MTTVAKSFSNLGLPEGILSTLSGLGYEKPTSIQELSIPILMDGGDLSAQAQTGTGKTAAFALPIIAHIDMSVNAPQAIVITPTRELAIQVAEAFHTYAKHVKGFHVLPIYGGQAYSIQLRALKRGVHVIVGTPGRVMDHLRRKTISLDAIKAVVLDEGDEMLNMGFRDDIEWILEQMTHDHQTALFSATMPPAIQKIAKRYLKNAKDVHIKSTTNTVETIDQFYTLVSNDQKLDVLTRFLEVEEIQAAIIFTKTKNSSAELAEKLQARGYTAAALNGDMNQSLREKVINQIKRGTLDIIVATDVAARGIDVDRITHVINYDIPNDTDSYIHRIGRTGRAGRKGKALLFVTPRERRLLSFIERATNKSIKQVEPPSLKEMKENRSKQLADKLIGVIDKSSKLDTYREMIDDIIKQTNCDPKDIAAALVYLNQQSNPIPTHEIKAAKDERDDRSRGRKKSSRFNDRSSRFNDRRSSDRPSRNKKKKSFSSSERSSERSSDRPRGRSSERSEARSSDRPGGRSSERSNGRSFDRPGGRSSERSDARSSDRPGGRNSERSAGGRPSGRSLEKTSGKPAEKRKKIKISSSKGKKRTRA